MARVILPNGIIIENASEATLKSLVEGAEDGVHYNSATHGKVKIRNMATPHIKNAVLKNLRTELEGLKNVSRVELLQYLRRGVGNQSPTTLSMIKELTTRID